MFPHPSYFVFVYVPLSCIFLVPGKLSYLKGRYSHFLKISCLLVELMANLLNGARLVREKWAKAHEVKVSGNTNQSVAMATNVWCRRVIGKASKEEGEGSWHPRRESCGQA